MTKSPFNRSPQKGEQGNSPKVIIKQALPSLPKWIKSAASKGCSTKGNAGRGQSTPPKFEQSSANNDSSHLLFRSPRKKSQIKSTRSKRINAIKAHQLYYSLILSLFVSVIDMMRIKRRNSRATQFTSTKKHTRKLTLFVFSSSIEGNYSQRVEGNLPEVG